MRAKAAREAAKEKGLDLPPVMEERSTLNKNGNGDTGVESETSVVEKPAESEVGKGLFDGW